MNPCHMARVLRWTTAVSSIYEMHVFLAQHFGGLHEAVWAQNYHDWAPLQHWLQLMVSCAWAVRMAVSCAFLRRPFGLGLRRAPVSSKMQVALANCLPASLPGGLSHLNICHFMSQQAEPCRSNFAPFRPCHEGGCPSDHSSQTCQCM